MKNKFLTLILSICILIPCMYMLSACNSVKFKVDYDFGATYEYFDDAKKSQQVNKGEWIIGMPTIKEEYKEAFIGWYIKDTNSKIEDGDFIAGDIILEPRFDTSKAAPGGLYYNGKMTKSWSELLSNKDIENISYNDSTSYLTIKNYNLAGELVIPNTIEKMDTTFGRCNNLTSIYIGKNVQEIMHKNLPENGRSLSRIVVSEDNLIYDSRNSSNAIIETSNNKLIYGCKNTQIPNTVEVIGKFAFHGCTTLRRIDIPNSVVEIEQLAFWGCIGLTKVTIPDSVIKIGSSVFASCQQLTTVKLSSNMKEIEQGLFENTNLKSITIPDGIISIGQQAFNNCSTLNEIVLPVSVKSIYPFAFDDFSGNVYYLGSLTDKTNMFIDYSSNNFKNATWYYYSEIKPTDNGNYWNFDKYKTPTIWEIKE